MFDVKLRPGNVQTAEEGGLHSAAERHSTYRGYDATYIDMMAKTIRKNRSPPAVEMTF
jgi:hypothetical protein